MTRTRALLASLAAVLPVACGPLHGQMPTDPVICEKSGLTPGTAAYDACLKRKRDDHGSAFFRERMLDPPMPPPLN